MQAQTLGSAEDFVNMADRWASWPRGLSQRRRRAVRAHNLTCNIRSRRLDSMNYRSDRPNTNYRRDNPSWYHRWDSSSTKDQDDPAAPDSARPSSGPVPPLQSTYHQLAQQTTGRWLSLQEVQQSRGQSRGCGLESS